WKPSTSRPPAERTCPTSSSRRCPTGSSTKSAVCRGSPTIFPASHRRPLSGSEAMNTSEKIYSGKTKDLYALDNGNILLVFKDDVTGGEDGVIDPGANAVIGQVEGKGRKSLAMTDYFFKR